MSIKGRNSNKILQKMTGNNPKLDLVNVDVHTKFGQILSIRSQDIERKQNFGNNEGPSKGNNSSANFGKLTCIYTLIIPTLLISYILIGCLEDFILR